MPGGARDRILASAIELFSKGSYEETGLRDVAATAGVDVAYVHRAFGSKKRLFAEALGAAVRPRELFEAATEQLPEVLARDVLANRGSRIKGLDIIVRSMASPEAGSIVRNFITDEAVEPLSEKLGGRTTEAAVVAAIVIGIATLRYVIALAPLSEPEGGKLEDLLAHLIREAVAQHCRPLPS